MKEIPIYPAAEFKPDTEGVFVGLPESVYRAAPGVNVSPLHYSEDSMATYKWVIDNPAPPTPAMQFGTILHAAIYEPDKVPRLFVTKPLEFKDFKTKAAQEWRDAQTLPVLTPEDVETLEMMVRSFNAIPENRDLMARCLREVSAFKIHPETGLLLKGRADLWDREAPNRDVYDSKKLGGMRATMRNCSIRITEMNYHQQAAHYSYLFGAASFGWMFHTDTPPYEVGQFYASETMLIAGHDKNERAYRNIADCRKTGVWPGRFRKIELQKWQQEEIE